MPLGSNCNKLKKGGDNCDEGVCNKDGFCAPPNTTGVYGANPYTWACPSYGVGGKYFYSNTSDKVTPLVLNSNNTCNDNFSSKIISPCNNEWINTMTYSDGNCNGTSIAGPVTGKIPVYSLKRIAYNGDPISCCLSGNKLTNNNTNNNTNLWLSKINASPDIANVNGLYTCDPKYSDISSIDCIDPITNFCSLYENRMFWKNANGDSKVAWKSNCRGKVDQNTVARDGCKIFTYPSNPITGTPATYYEYEDGGPIHSDQKIMKQLCIPNNAYSEGIVARAIANATNRNANIIFSDEDSEYISNLLSYLPIDKPIQPATTTALKGLCSQVREKDFINAAGNTNSSISKNIIKACGCHMQQEAYSKHFSDVGYLCSPYCMNPATLKDSISSSDSKTSSGAVCKSTICAINDTSINIIKSTTGDITFKQACGDCKDGSCICLIEDADIYVEDSNTGNLNFSQNCSSCKVKNPDGSESIVDCATGKPSGNTPSDGGGNTPSGNDTPSSNLSPSTNSDSTTSKQMFNRWYISHKPIFYFTILTVSIILILFILWGINKL